MKKLFALLFTSILAFTLAMPVFAQETGAQTQEQTAPTTGKKMKKSKAKKAKAKKAKKEKKSKEAAAPAAQ